MKNEKRLKTQKRKWLIKNGIKKMENKKRISIWKTKNHGKWKTKVRKRKMKTKNETKSNMQWYKKLKMKTKTYKQKTSKWK